MKKNNLALLTLFIGAFLSSFSINLFAQKSESAKEDEATKQCSTEKFVMPASIAIGKNSFANFINVMSLPSGKRRKAFSDLSNESKAEVYRVQLALNFIKRPNLTGEQKRLIINTISKVSADIYDRDNAEKIANAEKSEQELQDKALAIFSPNEAIEVFSGLSGEKESDIALLKKYENILSLPSLSLRKRKLKEISSQERSDFWKAQMVYYIATAYISDVQREFIAKTIPYLIPRAFEIPLQKDVPLNDETKILDSLETEANNLFNKQEIFVIFMSVGLHKMVPVNIVDNSIPAPGDCECNYWCGALCWSCTRASSCTATTSGCGWYENKPCGYSCILVQNCP